VTTARDQLLGTVLLERSVVAEMDIRRAFAECQARAQRGITIGLGELLVSVQLLDPQYHLACEREIDQSGRGCGACGRTFMKPPMSPESCPGCGAPVQALPRSNAGPQRAAGIPSAAPLSAVTGGMANNDSTMPMQRPAFLSQPPGISGGGSIGLPGLGGPAVTSGRMSLTELQASAGLGLQNSFGALSGAQSSRMAPVPPTAPDSPMPCEDAGMKGDQIPIGSNFAEHEILSELGRGGMGVVYKARDLENDEVVALKVLIAGEFASPKVLKRFREEINVLEQLDIPGIIPIRRHGQERGLTFFTMAFIEGCELSDLIRERKLSLRRGLEIVSEIARAMEGAHDMGIIHRDLKPANVRVDEAGHAFVMDFGLAKDLEADHSMTRSGVPIGTPYYMSPEQARGSKDIDPRADVYSLGALLYEVITHRVPFKSKTTAELLRMIVDDDPVPPRQFRPHCTVEFEAICLQALRKDRDERYQSAADLADDIEAALAGEPIMARGESLGRQLAKRYKNHKTLFVAVGVALAALLIGGCVLWEMQRRAKIETARIERERAEENRRRQEESKRQAEKLRAQQLLQEKLEREQAAARLEKRITEARRKVWRELEVGGTARSYEEWKRRMHSAEDSINNVSELLERKLGPEDLYLMGLIQHRLGNFKKALEAYKKSGNEGLFRVRSHLARGLIYFLSEQDVGSSKAAFGRAIEASERGKALSESHERDAGDLARALRDLLTVEEPTRAQRAAMKLPRSPLVNFVRSLIAVRRSAIVQPASQAPMYARQSITEAISEARYDYFYLIQAASVELGLGQARRCSELLRRAEQVNDQLPFVYETRCRLFLIQGDFGEARRALGRARDRSRDRPSVLRKLEVLSRVVDKLEEKSKEPKPASEAEGSSPTITFKTKESQEHFSRGVTAWQGKRYEEAVAAFKEVLKAEPAHRRTRMLFASSIGSLGRRTEADRIFEELLAERPTPLIFQFWIESAQKSEHPEAAIPRFEKALKTFPKVDNLSYLYSGYLLTEGHYTEMLSFVRVKLKAQPEEPGYLFYLSKALLMLGKFDESFEAIRLSYQKAPKKVALVSFVLLKALSERIERSDAIFIQKARAELGNSAEMFYLSLVFQIKFGNESQTQKARETLKVLASKVNPSWLSYYMKAHAEGRKPASIPVWKPPAKTPKKPSSD